MGFRLVRGFLFSDVKFNLVNLSKADIAEATPSGEGFAGFAREFGTRPCESTHHAEPVPGTSGLCGWWLCESCRGRCIGEVDNMVQRLTALRNTPGAEFRLFEE